MLQRSELSVRCDGVHSGRMAGQQVKSEPIRPRAAVWRPSARLAVACPGCSWCGGARHGQSADADAAADAAAAGDATPPPPSAQPSPPPSSRRHHRAHRRR